MDTKTLTGHIRARLAAMVREEKKLARMGDYSGAIDCGGQQRCLNAVLDLIDGSKSSAVFRAGE